MTTSQLAGMAEATRRQNGRGRDELRPFLPSLTASVSVIIWVPLKAHACGCEYQSNSNTFNLAISQGTRETDCMQRDVHALLNKHDLMTDVPEARSTHYSLNFPSARNVVNAKVHHVRVQTTSITSEKEYMTRSALAKTGS